jgi:hypothetical protein
MNTKLTLTLLENNYQGAKVVELCIQEYLVKSVGT